MGGWSGTFDQKLQTHQHQRQDGRPPPTYGMLLPPSEEGRCGDRVARAARFMGTYQERRAALVGR